jgi:uncharacterized Zn finger protein
MVNLSEGVMTKAAKYLAEGRVMQDAVDDSVWWIEGSRQGAPYRVQIVLTAAGEVSSRTCTCRHGKAALGVAQCSHVVAAATKMQEGSA